MSAKKTEAIDPIRDMPYLTADVPGVGGLIKVRLEDFVVEEVPLYEPADEGTHTFFAIEKRGIDTLGAIRAIARALGKKPIDIGMAGLKDARAIARQVLSVEHVDPRDVLALDIPGIRILWARKHRNKLRLGHLKGNRFIIKLRNIDPDRKKCAETILQTLQARGVPNYFGPQRFGLRGDTWQIGRAIIRQDFKEALDVLLGRPGPTDRGKVRKARELYEAGRFAEAAKLWPPSYREERIACRALAKSKGSLRRAMFAIDKAVKRLYVSAYQSWLFNLVLAERIRRDCMDKLLAGDLAWLHDRGAVFLVDDPAREQPRADRFEISPTGPLFGYRMTQTQGLPGQIESQVLAAEGLCPQDFKQVKGHKVKGGRRPLRFALEDLDFVAGRDDLGPYFELRFFLPSGCYATSVLREVCKTDMRKIYADDQTLQGPDEPQQQADEPDS